MVTQTTNRSDENTQTKNCSFETFSFETWARLNTFVDRCMGEGGGGRGSKRAE